MISLSLMWWLVIGPIQSSSTTIILLGEAPYAGAVPSGFFQSVNRVYFRMSEWYKGGTQSKSWASQIIGRQYICLYI